MTLSLPRLRGFLRRQRAKAVLDQGDQAIGEVQVHALQASQSLSQRLHTRRTSGLVRGFAQVRLQGVQPARDQTAKAPRPRRRGQVGDDLAIDQLELLHRHLAGQHHEGDRKACLHGQVLNDGQKVRFAVPIVAVEEAHLGAAGADVVGEIVFDDAQPALAPTVKHGTCSTGTLPRRRCSMMVRASTGCNCSNDSTAVIPHPAETKDR